MTKEFRIFKAALPESLQAAFESWYDRLFCKLEVADMDLTDALRGNLSLAEYATRPNKIPAPTCWAGDPPNPDKAVARCFDLEVGQ